MIKKCLNIIWWACLIASSVLPCLDEYDLLTDKSLSGYEFVLALVVLTGFVIKNAPEE